VDTLAAVISIRGSVPSPDDVRGIEGFLMSAFAIAH